MEQVQAVLVEARRAETAVAAIRRFNTLGAPLSCANIQITRASHSVKWSLIICCLGVPQGAYMHEEPEHHMSRNLIIELRTSNVLF